MSAKREGAVRAPVDHVKKAAEALSDLNTFAIVVTILEGGHLHAPSYAAGDRVIRICQAEQQKRLRDYDKHRALAAAVGTEDDHAAG